MSYTFSASVIISIITDSEPTRLVTRPTGLPSWTELAEDWLTVKRVGRRADDSGNSDRARRADLRRWASAINEVQGRPAGDIDDHQSLSEWDRIGLELGSTDLLLRALDRLADDVGPATRRRMLSTLRGYCRFLVTRGALPSDPTATDELRVSAHADDDIRAFTTGVVERLVRAAGDAPTTSRTRWPARDRAIIAILAYCGLRVAELCALEQRDIDTTGDHAVLRLRHATKGGRRRVVPLPQHVHELIEHYLAERSLAATHRHDRPLLLRRNGTPLNQQFVDTLLRHLCRETTTTPPPGALAHALRHWYGTELARRGVPLLIIQQLLGHVDPRTTSIYTRAHATDLTEALNDAGLLQTDYPYLSDHRDEISSGGLKRSRM